MTHDQAAELILKCKAPYSGQRMEPEHADALYDYLIGRDYERMKVVVARAIETSRYIPSIATLAELYAQIYSEGIPGAAAYKPMPTQQGPTSADEYALWRQRKFISMSDEEYMEYITARSKGESGRQEMAWRYEYEQALALDQIAGRVGA
jgi:hypothetical protein